VNEKQQIYIVKYNKGAYDYLEEINIFATFDKKKATDYVLKAETLLENLREYYEKFQDESWENIKRVRYEALEDIEFYIEELKIR
jgi:hypothetical protein